MKEFFFTLSKTVAVEFFGIMGIFFLIGTLLSLLQSRTNAYYRETIGWKGILLTAWIGTPIHELSHVIVAKLFRHKLVHVSLFEPNKATGGLGQVDHTYDKRSIYQRLGNFFIGAAPMIGGVCILFFLLYTFVPNGKSVFVPLTQSHLSISQIVKGIQESAQTLFSWNNIHTPLFWVFLYISFAISSHIAPSKQDRRGMWRGLVWVVFLLILLNIIPALLNIDLTRYVSRVYTSLAVIVALFLYALLISALHFLVAFVLLHIPHRLLSR